MVPLKVGYFIGCIVVSMIIQMLICLQNWKLFAPDRYIYFIADAPHLMKTARNALYHSGIHKWFWFEIASYPFEIRFHSFMLSTKRGERVGPWNLGQFCRQLEMVFRNGVFFRLVYSSSFKIICLYVQVRQLPVKFINWWGYAWDLFCITNFSDHRRIWTLDLLV